MFLMLMLCFALSGSAYASDTGCSDNNGGEHNYVYTNNGAEGHTVKCGCGVELSESHSLVYEHSIPGSHTISCDKDCGYGTSADCSGGTATCTSAALCPMCKNSYGNPLGHAPVYSVDSESIKQTCSNNCTLSASVSISIDPDASLVYTGSNIEPCSLRKVGSWLIDMPELVYENNINASTDTSEAKCTLTVADMSISKSFKIEKAPVEYTVSSYSGTYDGQSHDFTVTVTKPAGCTVTYSDSEGGPYSATVPSLKAADTRTVYFKIEPTDTNYETIESSGTLSISKAPLSLTADNKTVTYGEPQPSFTAAFSGFVNGEDESVLGGDYTFSTSYTQGSDAGLQYDITVNSTLSSNNYDIAVTNANLSVAPRTLGIEWSNTSFDYDGTAKIPTATITDGIYNNDTVSVSVTGEQTNAGNYTATASLSGEKSKNYLLSDGSATCKFTIASAAQAAPSGLTAVNESIFGVGDGKITGVNADMEYRAESETDYTPVTGTEITGLTAGKYYIRNAAKTNYNASADCLVSVNATRTLSVTLPATQTGYSLTADASAPAYDSDVKLSFSLSNDYMKGANFAVKLNNSPITLAADGTYTITAIKDDAVVAVEGVIPVPDTQAPVLSVSLSGNSLSGNFYSSGSFSITATDNKAVDEIQYYVSSSSVMDPQTITGWQSYTGPVALSGADRTVYFYAKASDASGNVSYKGYDAVVYDATAPVISGLVNGDTYVTTQAGSVSDANLLSVTVGGSAASSSFTVAGDRSATVTITATDKAGNSSSITVYIEPISSLYDSVENINAGNVKLSDEVALRNVLDQVNYILKNECANATAAEKIALNAIFSKVNEPLNIIRDVNYVLGLINDLPLPDTIQPWHWDTAVDYVQARDAYNALSAYEKSLVGKHFKNKLDRVYLALVDYQIIAGDGSRFVRNSEKTVSFIGSGLLRKFSYVAVDGEVISSSYYAAYADKYGRTVVMLTTDYLESLSDGSHNIRIHYTDGETGLAGFRVYTTYAARTGDPANFLLWGGMLLVSVGGIVTAIVLLRKKKGNGRK